MDEPWEAEIEQIIRNTGTDPFMVRSSVILRWMYFGDLRPLAHAIINKKAFDECALHYLARMILDENHEDVPYRVTVKRRSGKGGAHKKLEKFIRDFHMSKQYKALKNALGSDTAFELVADSNRLSDSAVRKTQTRYK